MIRDHVIQYKELNHSMFSTSNRFVSKFDYFIWVLVVWVMSQPAMPTYLTFELNRIMAWRNSFNIGQIGFNCMSNKLETSMCQAHSNSLSTIHLWIFSIFEKIIFPLLEIITTIFFHFFSSQSNFGAAWLLPNSDSQLSPFHFLCHLFVNVSFHFH